MSPIGCADFINSCTGDKCQANDKRVNETFGAFDKDKDGLLTIDDFLEFYSSACH